MSQQETAGSKPFNGFRGPNYTQVPDQLFDELLPVLSGSELKVLLYIIRRTFGFKRDTDAISLSQMLGGIVKRDGTRLDHGAGVTKKPLLKALRSLEERGIIFVERRTTAEHGHRPSIYRLKIIDQSPLGGEPPPRGGAKLPQGDGGEPPPSPRGQKSPTQERGEQERGEQETELNSSNSREVQSNDGRAVRSARTADISEIATSSAESVGAVITRRESVSRTPKQDRPESLNENYQKIQDYIADRAREFNDTAPLKSSTTRAWHLFERSGLPIDEFISRIFQARSLTQEGTARITKTAVDPDHRVKRKTKMAYFFAVLEDQLGLSQKQKSEKTPNPDNNKPTSRRGRDDKYDGIIQT